LSQADYRLYSEMAMHAALWHKRMAQALLRKKGTSEPLLRATARDPTRAPGLRMEKFLKVDDPEWPAVAGQKLGDGVYRLAYHRWETFWKTDAPAGRVCVKGRVKGRMAVGLGRRAFWRLACASVIPMEFR